MQEAADTLPINTVEMNDTKIGVITSGIPYQYVKEALPDASVLKLGMVNPLPRKMIEEFASKVEKLYIVEELDPVIEEQVKSWGIQAVGKEIFTVQGEYSANMLRDRQSGRGAGDRTDPADGCRDGRRSSVRAVLTEASTMC